MKYIILNGKKVFVTDDEYKRYWKERNHENYIFGRQEYNANVVQLDYLPLIADEKANVEEEFERGEIRKKLWKALDALRETNPESFELINLYFFEKVRPKEIAEHFEIARSTVDFRLKKALGILRKNMGDKPE